jgi:hypothetical protein
MTGMPTPNWEPSLNLSWMWTGAPLPAAGPVELGAAEVLGAAGLDEVVDEPPELGGAEVLAEPLPPELQAVSTIAPTSTATTPTRWRGRGGMLGFVTPLR